MCKETASKKIGFGSSKVNRIVFLSIFSKLTPTKEAPTESNPYSSAKTFAV